MQEARARLNDLATTESAPELRELHAVALSTVKRLLREMDLEQRVRRQVQLGRTTRPRAAYLSRPALKRRPITPETTPTAETQPLPRLDGDGRDQPRP
jgi:hypothetical protein